MVFELYKRMVYVKGVVKVFNISHLSSDKSILLCYVLLGPNSRVG